MGETYAEARQELEALLTAFERLAGLPDSPLASVIVGTRTSLETGRFTVVVVGEFKRGKTTFVNALLGANILPTAVVPLTSVVTLVQWGPSARAEVRFLDGRIEEVGLDELATYVTERGNPENHRRVDRVVLEYPADALQDGVVLVDTPGVGSIYEHNTDAALAFLPEADAAIFLTSADPPISRSEQQFLDHVRDESARTFFILNKADYLSERDLAEAVAFTEDVLASVLDRTVQVYPVSALRAIEPSETRGHRHEAATTGFDRFVRDFRDFLLHDKGRVILASAARRLRKATIDEMNSVDVEERAMRIPEQEFAQVIAEIERAFADVRLARDDVRTLLRHASEELLSAVESDLDELRAQATAAVLDDCEQYVNDLDDPRTARSEVEEAIRDAIRRRLDAWRREEERKVADRFRTATTRFVQETNSLVRRTIEITASLLEIDLQVGSVPEGIDADTRFSYRFFEELTLGEAILPDMRRLLTEKAARRLLLKDVRERVPMLVDRHRGRMRWDFDQRLDRSRRELERDLDTRLDATIESLRSGLERARRQRAGAAEAVDACVGALTARGAALEEGLGELDRLLDRFHVDVDKEMAS